MAGRSDKVIGVGMACLDQLVLWQDMSLPVAGNRVLDCQVQGGGMVGTGLVAVSRLGGRAELWGVVGTDWSADLILRQLADDGVDVAGVVRAGEVAGPKVLVCVDGRTGERHFMRGSGFNDPEMQMCRPGGLADAGCLLVDGCRFASALAAAAEARKLGVPVVADISHMSDNWRKLLQHVDYAIASEHLAKQLKFGHDVPAALAALTELGPTHAVITLGPRGLAWRSPQSAGSMDAFQVDVVDTTGAGDVFHGAFCYGLTQGFDFDRNLRFASATAALKCRRLGGRAGIPTRPEVDAFLAGQGQEP